MLDFGRAVGVAQEDKGLAASALVLRHLALGGVGHLGIQSASLVATLPQIGDLFVEDIYGGKMVFGGGVNVWARQLNPEPRTTLGDAHIELAGGSQLWILGLKIEQPGPGDMLRECPCGRAVHRCLTRSISAPVGHNNRIDNRRYLN